MSIPSPPFYFKLTTKHKISTFSLTSSSKINEYHVDIKSVTEYNDNNVMFKYVCDIVRWITEAAARKEKSFVWKLGIEMDGNQFKCINGFRFPYHEDNNRIGLNI